MSGLMAWMLSPGWTGWRHEGSWWAWRLLVTFMTAAGLIVTAPLGCGSCGHETTHTSAFLFHCLYFFLNFSIFFWLNFWLCPLISESRETYSRDAVVGFINVLRMVHSTVFSDAIATGCIQRGPLTRFCEDFRPRVFSQVHSLLLNVFFDTGFLEVCIIGTAIYFWTINSFSEDQH